MRVSLAVLCLVLAFGAAGCSSKGKAQEQPAPQAAPAQPQPTQPATVPSSAAPPRQPVPAGASCYKRSNPSKSRRYADDNQTCLRAGKIRSPEYDASLRAFGWSAPYASDCGG